MFIEAFASLMQKAKIGTVATDIFCHHMPANVKSGVLLINPNTGISIDHELHGFFHDSFTIIVRNATITKAMEKANKIMAMFPIEETESDGVYFRLVRPMTMPIAYPKNDGSLIEAGIPIEFAGYLLN
ncbi:minor capsid protein (plasmid) [Buttiauxella sp. WJP83]|uniref:minor capsid protein n=1 Tax=Buttiauxella sp. WJP83 TaxID=2986951 RepID=UPI0022DD9750|nr:minor capsid protein [Buttiauxella sp. WJP83]WBM72997.1 minor capsid protein [Buttiauxella sp. WJP83]